MCCACVRPPDNLCTIARHGYNASNLYPVREAMWPESPDEFVSRVFPAGKIEHPEALYFAFDGDQMLTLTDGESRAALTHDEVQWLDSAEAMYLGELGGRPCLAIEVKGCEIPGYATQGLRSLLGRVDQQVFYLAGRALQLLEWNRNHRFCGRCGSETQDHDSDRAKVCPACRLVSYPRLSPSIIVLVRRGEEMLLARNAAWPKGFFSTLAGFVEPGESIEQTVHREVMEEVGLRITNLQYKGSQSWPFPNSLMLGFHAEYLEGDVHCQDDEIAEAHWYRFDQMPSVPPKWAISRWLIDDFVNHCSQGGCD